MNDADTLAAVRAWRALEAMPRDTDDDHATWALTLHMVQHHAPRFFSAHVGEAQLTAALHSLEALSTDFGSHDDDHDWTTVQGRLDALYLRCIRGLPLPPFDVDGLRAAIAQIATVSPVGGWLLAELARPLGVVVDVADAVDDEVLEGYRATHIVLLQGRYLAQAAVVDASVLAQIAQAGAMAFAHGRWDLLAECVFCLQAQQVPYERGWVLALRGAQGADGAVVEDGAPEQRAHCTAAALVALAGAAERPA